MSFFCFVFLFISFSVNVFLGCFFSFTCLVLTHLFFWFSVNPLIFLL